MTLAQVRCFLEVVKSRSFSGAAAKMFISQPAISKQIRLLEDSLGVPLLDRSSARPELTEAGRLYYAFFRRSQEEFRQVRERAEKLCRGEGAVLRVGCLDGWDVSSFNPDFRLMLGEIAPETRLMLFGYDHVRLVERLKAGETDLGLGVGISLEQDPALRTRALFRIPLVLLLSRQHPLAERERLGLEDVREQPFYVIAPEPGCENAMERLTVSLCQRAGFTPRVEHVPSSAAALMQLQSGAGVQLTTAMTAACKLPSYRAFILTERTAVSVAWVEDGRKPEKLRFAEELGRHYAEKAGEAL